MSGMNKTCDKYPWCTTKTTITQNDFGLSFMRSSHIGHLECTNGYCDYMYCNGDVHNNTKWIRLTLIFFVWKMMPQ